MNANIIFIIPNRYMHRRHHSLCINHDTLSPTTFVELACMELAYILFLRPCYTVQCFMQLDKLHGPLHRVTCCAMVKIVARQVAPIVAQSRIGFYFLQRLQQFFSALHRVTPFQQLVSQCFHNNDCERMRVAAVY